MKEDDFSADGKTLPFREGDCDVKTPPRKWRFLVQMTFLFISMSFFRLQPPLVLVDAVGKPRPTVFGVCDHIPYAICNALGASCTNLWC